MKNVNMLLYLCCFIFKFSIYLYCQSL